MPRLRLPRGELRHWSAIGLLALTGMLYLVAGLSVAGVGSDHVASARLAGMNPALASLGALPPQPEPLQFQNVKPEDAIAINAAVPLADGPNPAARPFALAARSGEDRSRALECLTEAVYYEAATEPLEGQRAVAQVVLNRVRHPAFPKSVCGVVYQGSERTTGCQFTFTCDGALTRAPLAALWKQAKDVAQAALEGAVYAPVGWSTHYHANYVVPYWSSSLVKDAVVGHHIFYRWLGGWGRPLAFGGRYTGLEPDPQALRLASRTVKVGPPSPAELVQAQTVQKELLEAAKKQATQVGSIDSFQSAVLRRYEPLKGDNLASVLSKQLPAQDQTASSRWAMTGQGGDSGPALGSKPAAAAKPDAKTPTAVPELAGVSFKSSVKSAAPEAKKEK
jgi:spore germination cell wall hydrolase CwlJ-like protein